MLGTLPCLTCQTFFGTIAFPLTGEDNQPIFRIVFTKVAEPR
jgi:hypothetical protein